LDAARALRAKRVPIRVIAVDDAGVPGSARDSAMALSLLAAKKPSQTAVFLVGDLHARTKPGAPWNREIIWAGVRLRSQEPKLVSLDNRYLGGQAWLCLGNSSSDCRIEAGVARQPIPRRPGVAVSGQLVERLRDQGGQGSRWSRRFSHRTIRRNGFHRLRRHVWPVDRGFPPSR